MRKMIAGLLACVVLLCAFAPFACAADPVASGSVFTSGYYTCAMLSYNTATIITYSGEEASVTIPAELNGIRITGVSANAFQANIELIDLVIPEGVESLGDYAFQRCPNLTEVSLPATLEDVGLNPFAGCEALSDINIAEGSPYLLVSGSVLFSREDRRLIYYPKLLDKGPYEVPDGVRIIGASAFYECDNVTELKLPESVHAIGTRAF